MCVVKLDLNVLVNILCLIKKNVEYLLRMKYIIRCFLLFNVFFCIKVCIKVVLLVIIISVLVGGSDKCFF